MLQQLFTLRNTLHLFFKSFEFAVIIEQYLCKLYFPEYLECSKVIMLRNVQQACIIISMEIEIA